jgi:hypothetical protein
MIGVGVSAYVVVHPRLLHQPSAEIERVLRAETPIGAPVSDVLKALKSRGIDAKVHRVNIPANSDYPLTRTGGASFIHETVGEYGLILKVSVEVFYVFDRSDRLADVRIRKTTDGL